MGRDTSSANHHQIRRSEHTCTCPLRQCTCGVWVWDSITSNLPGLLPPRRSPTVSTEPAQPALNPSAPLPPSPRNSILPPFPPTHKPRPHLRRPHRHPLPAQQLLLPPRNHMYSHHLLRRLPPFYQQPVQRPHPAAETGGMSAGADRLRCYPPRRGGEGVLPGGVGVLPGYG